MTSSTPKPMSKAEAIAEFEDIRAAFIKERAHMAELCTSMARYILDGGILTTALSDALEDLRIAAVNVGDDADEEGS